MLRLSTDDNDIAVKATTDACRTVPYTRSRARRVSMQQPKTKTKNYNHKSQVTKAARKQNTLPPVNKMHIS